ncbi:MAG: hypothetical protein MZV70_21430 [Desulfobacterales bacterium]|nr:hypothetical protein [Desulfobacterales bacterium]
MKKRLIYVLLLMALVLAACAPAGSGTDCRAVWWGRTRSGWCPNAVVIHPNLPTRSTSIPGSNTLILPSRNSFKRSVVVEVVRDKFRLECERSRHAPGWRLRLRHHRPLRLHGPDHDLRRDADGARFQRHTQHQAHGEPQRQPVFRPEQKYTVPWFWGTSGFAVDTNVVTDVTNSRSMMFDPNSPYCGKMSMLDDQRETLGAALMYLGYSINDTDPAHLEEAKDLLVEQSERASRPTTSQTNDDLIIAGETVLGHIWTGDAILAGLPDYGGREGITYVIPAGRMHHLAG